MLHATDDCLKPRKTAVWDLKKAITGVSLPISCLHACREEEEIFRFEEKDVSLGVKHFEVPGFGLWHLLLTVR